MVVLYFLSEIFRLLKSCSNRDNNKKKLHDLPNHILKENVIALRLHAVASTMSAESWRTKCNKMLSELV